MASITDLAYTSNMSAAKKPFLTDLVETLDSIQTHINDKIGDNIEQFVLDAFPSAYTFDDDGLKNFATWNLFDKQTGNDLYTGGDFTITTTAAWTDLDATNASITFTPDLLAGDFKCVFQFNVECVSTNATNEADLAFRITDGTTNSTGIASIHLVTGANATTTQVPVTIIYTFDSLSASAKTVKLQYYITTRTAMTIKVLANTSEPIYMEIEKT